MFSRFFIDRPIFASVLSIAITLAGGLALWSLPLAQYPPVTPPTVQVNCTYPGASAQVVAESVAAPIEQQVNGVENMLYMSSQCANDGSYNLTVTFRQGINLNLAQVLVQNRVNLALPMLPDVLKKTGVNTRKMAPDILMSVNIQSPGGTYDQLYLSNYALLHLKDELLRLPGISDIFIAGQRDYSMRVWLNADQLAARKLTAGDVVAALREQNVPVACGQIGQPPVPAGQLVQLTLTTLGRLKTPEQFQKLILRATPDGRIVRLRDVARIELAAKNEDVTCRVNGRPSVGLIIFQLPDANALDLAAEVHKKMRQLAEDFPPDLIYESQYDTTPYTRECIREVFKSLRDAVLLVAFVVLLFLQNWRSALIPLLAVPVAVVGAFGVMFALGFSLNNLTLFGLVLAIGIVVDDAIVVVEAVEHHIDHGLSPHEATIKALQQVSGPVVAVGLVLSAVFVPCAFVSGITGQFFRQFALTIAASTLISTFNSLTLSPALAALLLRPRGQEPPEVLPRLLYAAVGGWAGYVYLTPTLGPWLAVAAGAAAGWLVARAVNFILRGAFGLFHAGFRRAASGYHRAVGKLLRASALVLVLYAGLLGLTAWQFLRTPKGFIPTQDMGYLLLSLQLPDAASAERCREVTRRAAEICRSTRGVKHTVSYSGNSLALGVGGSIFASMFVILDEFSQREEPGLSADEIAMALRMKFAKQVPDAQVSVFPAPPIRGVGRSGGFKFMVEDRGDLGLQALQAQIDRLAEKAGQLRGQQSKQPLLTMQPNIFRANAPQLYVDLNRRQCMTMGVALVDAFNTLRAYLGSLYVNDINLFGRTWQVIVQADAPFRDDPDKARQLKVRNREGGMVPIGALADIREVSGPLVLTRYNMYPAAAVQGSAGRGVSSGQAIALMQQTADRELAPTMRYEWTDMAYLELQAGHTAMVLFGLAVAMVFLVLAAQYESWSLPLAVILVVPMCLLSAVLGVTFLPVVFQYLQQWLRTTLPGANTAVEINIFTQIGFVVLVGLASKNAILIVEFAKQRHEEGLSRQEAALAACQLRLRPIVMTSLAFVLGVSPLLVARGAGAEMRRTLGTAVFSGMLGVTLFGLFLTPVFFNVIDWLSGTQLFRSRWARYFHTFTVGLFGLGFPRAVLRHAGRLLRRVSRRPPDDSTPPS